jgi:tetratricopeptide (TPR) repeat protein
VGGIYYSAKSYDLAIRFFSDAANLKPDYANAYFNLSIALNDKGDIQNAAVVAQQLVNLLKSNPNSADYKLASKYLDSLKAKLAEAAKQNAEANANGTTANTQTAPAAQTNSALQQNTSGVKVNNLNNAPSVTPVPSIKPNPTANLPKTTPAAKQ